MGKVTYEELSKLEDGQFYVTYNDQNEVIYISKPTDNGDVYVYKDLNSSGYDGYYTEGTFDKETNYHSEPAFYKEGDDYYYHGHKAVVGSTYEENGKTYRFYEVSEPKGDRPGEVKVIEVGAMGQNKSGTVQGFSTDEAVDPPTETKPPSINR